MKTSAKLYGKRSWKNRTAVLIGDSENMYLAIREIIKQFDWKLTCFSKDVKIAINQIESGKAEMIIVDDTFTDSSITTMRSLLYYPISYLTPIICILMDKNLDESKTIQGLGKIKTMSKPVTPSRFSITFNDVIQTWETQQYSVARKLNYVLAHATLQQQLKTFEKLKSLSKFSSIASRGKAMLHFKAGNYKLAEKECLKSLNETPSDLGLIITLADIYMNSAMIPLARKLFTIINEKYNSIMVLPDIVQSACLMEDFEVAEANIKKMLNKEYLYTTNMTFLGRVLYSIGKAEEAAVLLGSNNFILDKLNSDWKMAEARSKDPITA